MKVCFCFLLEGFCQSQRKPDRMEKNINRETEQKTGDDVNKNKLVTETEGTEENKDGEQRRPKDKEERHVFTHMILTAW